MGFKPDKLERTYAYELVAADVRAKIAEGALRPGDVLPGETELATMLGVNRNTVREGIRQLEVDGLVRRVSGRQLEICVPLAEDIVEKQSRALRMMDVTFIELWRVAIATEPLAAELAARFRAEADIAALEANMVAMERATRTGGDTIALDTEFHRLVVASADNRALVMAHAPISILLSAALSGAVADLPFALPRQLEAHRRITLAIKAGDAEAARLWMRRHVEDFRRGYEAAGMPLDRPIMASGSRS